MKKIIIGVLILLVSAHSFGQGKNPPAKKFQLGIGIGTGIYSNDGTAFATSAELQGESRLSPGISIFSTLAYNRLFGDGGSAGYASLLAGPRVWFTDHFFIGFGGGIAFAAGDGASSTAFNYNPHMGVDTKKAQFSLGYNAISEEGDNVGFIQAKAIFKLK